MAFHRPTSAAIAWRIHHQRALPAPCFPVIRTVLEGES